MTTTSKPYLYARRRRRRENHRSVCGTVMPAASVPCGRPYTPGGRQRQLRTAQCAGRGGRVMFAHGRSNIRGVGGRAPRIKVNLRVDGQPGVGADFPILVVTPSPITFEARRFAVLRVWPVSHQRSDRRSAVAKFADGFGRQLTA